MYKKIMVPLDGSKLAETVLPHLETVVKGCESPEVIFVQAVEPLTIPYGRELSQFTSFEQLKAFETHQKSEAEKYLKEIVERLRKAGANARSVVIYGRASETLVDFVNNNNVDLVIMATHGRSEVGRWVWGSVADRLLRSLNVPILMVRAKGEVPGK